MRVGSVQSVKRMVDPTTNHLVFHLDPRETHLRANERLQARDPFEGMRRRATKQLLRLLRLLL